MTKLKRGDWVEVRSKEEILATLDEHGRLAGLPFMPEMFEYCGRRIRVFKRAHKTCDTVGPCSGRRMKDAVHLEDVRCDGQGHGGCQASCMNFWKDAWLKRVRDCQPVAEKDEPDLASTALPSPNPILCSQRTVIQEAVAQPGVPDGEPVYRCQATELPKATGLLPWWHISQYVEDYTSGNVGLGQVIMSGLHSGWHHLSEAGIGLGWLMRWLYDKVQSFRGGVPYPWRRGAIPVGQRTPSACLNLQPGEWARVKSYKEILATLDQANRNRGMFFGPEEVPSCGRTLRVRQRVERIIEERTGRMLQLKTPAVILEGAYCQAHYCEDRKFCPRAIFTFWREAWLERVSPSGVPEAEAVSLPAHHTSS